MHCSKCVSFWGTSYSRPPTHTSLPPHYKILAAPLPPTLSKIEMRTIYSAVVLCSWQIFSFHQRTRNIWGFAIVHNINLFLYRQRQDGFYHKHTNWADKWATWSWHADAARRRRRTYASEVVYQPSASHHRHCCHHYCHHQQQAQLHLNINRHIARQTGT